MSFIYSCIGDNSPENREHLEKVLGYTYFGSFLIDRENSKYIKTVQGTNKYIVSKGYPDDKCINCIGNDPLFLAIAALRDDIDYMHWFKTDFENKLIPDVKDMYLCKAREFCGITTMYKGEEFRIGSAGFHKASLAELQEHFKRV